MKLFSTAERNKQLHDPHCEPTNLCFWENKPEKSSGLPVCGFIAQLVEIGTGIRGSQGFGSVQRRK